MHGFAVTQSVSGGNALWFRWISNICYDAFVLQKLLLTQEVTKAENFLVFQYGIFLEVDCVFLVCLFTYL